MLPTIRAAITTIAGHAAAIALISLAAATTTRANEIAPQAQASKLYLAKQQLQKGARADSATFKRAEDILQWINTYRRNPNPQDVPTAVRTMSRLGLFRDLDQAGVYIGFIAGVIGSNRKSADSLIAQMFPLPPTDQVALIRAIAYSNHPRWQSMLQKFAERMPARHALIKKYLYGSGKTLIEMPLDEKSHLVDAHWGYFFATGYSDPIERIVSILAWTTQRESVERLTIGSMAKWTLATNASREKDLLDILKAQMNTQPKNVRAPLAEVIEAAETFETGKLRKDALASIEELKAKGPDSARKFSWWTTAGQTVLAVGCVAAGALGQVDVAIPCVVGGAASSAALKLFGQ